MAHAMHCQSLRCHAALQAVACLSSAIFWSDTLRADDWPRWRGPDGTGVVTSEGDEPVWIGESPEVLWHTQVGIGFSSIAVAEGRLYTLGNANDTDTLWCLDADTGDVIWQYSYPQPLDPNLFEGGPTATPTVFDGQVFSFSRRGLALCCHAVTGDVLWATDVAQRAGVNVPQWGFASSPVVQDRLVLLNAGSAGVALHRETGEIAWQSDNSEDAAYATPVIATLQGRTLALILSGKALHAVDPLTGAEAWNYRWLTRYGVNAADPLVAGDRLLLTSGYSKGAALVEAGPEGPTEVWRSRELRNQMSPGVLVNRTIFAVDGDAGGDCLLRAVDLDTGDILWTESGLGSATLIAVQDRLLILSSDGELVVAAASRQGFQALMRGKILTGKCWSAPALANRVLYARNAAGELVAVRLHR